MMHVGCFITVTTNDMQWRESHDFGAGECMMSYVARAYIMLVVLVHSGDHMLTWFVMVVSHTWVMDQVLLTCHLMDKLCQWICMEQRVICQVFPLLFKDKVFCLLIYVTMYQMRFLNVGS